MKFSLSLLKKLAPSIKNPQDFAERFSLHAFEVEGVKGDTVEINIPANRYSDAASHLGIAKLWAAIAGGLAERVRVTGKTLSFKKRGKGIAVEVQDKKLCPRYIAVSVSVPKIGESPQWIKEALWACGLKPINAVVDVMNYVMLEVGQPLHAFDADKLASKKLKFKPRLSGGRVSNLKTIIVRNAVRGEKIETLDGGTYVLEPRDLVIADAQGPLAIAGIKGGKRAEVTPGTRRIVIEAANFSPTGIYHASRRLGLQTDAALRFGHGLAPALAEAGARRAAELLARFLGGRVEEAVIADSVKQRRTVLKFDAESFNRLTGLKFSAKECLVALRRLGFGVKGLFVTAPTERLDIQIPEDMFEEVINLAGYDVLPATPPRVHLAPAHVDDAVQLKREAREILAGFGFSEVYNHSFIPEGEARDAAKGLAHSPVPLANPIAADKAFLRPSLAPGLLRNTHDNLRFFDAVRIFEVGKVFWEAQGKIQERLMLGLVVAGKDGAKNGEAFLQLKGLVEEFLGEMGVEELFLPPHDFSLPFLGNGGSVRIESGHAAIGYLGALRGVRGTVAEIDLDALLNLEREENAFQPLPKHPAVTRDLSLLVDRDTRIGEMIQSMHDADAAHLERVELVDEYEDERLGQGRQSVTFRLVFRAEDRTLTEHEVGKELETVIGALKNTFGAEVR